MITYEDRNFMESDLVDYQIAVNFLESERIHNQAMTNSFTGKNDLDEVFESESPNVYRAFYESHVDQRKARKVLEERFGERFGSLYDALSTNSHVGKLYESMRNERRRHRPWRRGFKGPYRTTINGAPSVIIGYDHLDGAAKVAKGDSDVDVHGYDETASHGGLRGNWALQLGVKNSQIMIHGSAMLKVNGHRGDFSFHAYIAPEDMHISYEDGIPVIPDELPYILVNGLYVSIYISEDPKNVGRFKDHEKDCRFVNKLEEDILASNVVGIPIINSGSTIAKTTVDGKKLKVLGRPRVWSESLVITRANYERGPKGDQVKKVISPDGLDPRIWTDEERLEEAGKYLDSEVLPNLAGQWEERPDKELLLIPNSVRQISRY